MIPKNLTLTKKRSTRPEGWLSNLEQMEVKRPLGLKAMHAALRRKRRQSGKKTV